jgi:hypothetical protein
MKLNNALYFLVSRLIPGLIQFDASLYDLGIAVFSSAENQTIDDTKNLVRTSLI